MDTRRTRRKRRNSAISNLEPSSPTLRSKTRGSIKNTLTSGSEASHQPAKKVRFSDPGPRLQHGSDYSTGLTPAMQRTSFEEPEDVDALVSTPSRRARRRSTPLRRSRGDTDSSLPHEGSPERVLQFTPLRQLLDSRTQRRIRRLGLSDEINSLEREKRASAQYEKTLQLLQRERDSLKEELELAKRPTNSPESPSATSERECITYGSSIKRPRPQEARQPSPIGGLHSPLTVTDSETDTIMINDSGFEGDTFLVSNSPDIRGLDFGDAFMPNNLSLLSQEQASVDASVQTSQPTSDHNAEFLALTLDLEASKKEKRRLFEACRSRLCSFSGTELERHLRESSPPQNFLEQILPTLLEALDHASDATRTLDIIQHELSNMGFSGLSADEIIGDMRDRFRDARLQLERAVPGETQVGLSDGCSTLSALVKRVELLVQNLSEEQAQHQGSVGRERALRGQFDNLLVRYEASSKKIGDLENSIASSAGDMLHTRMRMQELEREAEEQVIGIDRLNAALSKYHDEVKDLEALVTRLEDEKTKCQEEKRQEVAQLELNLTCEKTARQNAESTVVKQEALIRELEDAVKENKVQFSDLMSKVDMLEQERCKAVETMEQKIAQETQSHEREMGSMNARISELNTALELAKADAEKLRTSKADLEEQLHLEMEARDNLLDKWAEEQTRSFAFMKATVNSERRKAKVRAANWEMKSDGLQADEMAIGSEPITPVSMTRFVDVEVGRGKHRRRLDSGVGILTDDDLEDEVDAGSGDGAHLPSDPADL